MSVVLPTDSWQRIVPVIDSIAALPECASLEVVLVIPRERAAMVDQARLAVFAASRVVAVDSVLPLGPARAAGVREATAEFVFISETHCFPQPGMFTALIAAHRRGCTMAVPAFTNWNPDCAASWAGFITGYAPWSEGLPAQSLNSAPIFNVSYRRSFFAQFGEDLEDALSEGVDIVGRLREGGDAIRFVPEARLAHANISRRGEFLRQRFLAGRVIGGNRSGRWPLSRRAVYALASPVVPFVLLRRNRAGIRRVLTAARPPRGTLPLVVIGAVFQAAGEMAGYITGDRRDVRIRYDDDEVARLDHTIMET
jgi:hypothetical protein